MKRFFLCSFLYFALCATSHAFTMTPCIAGSALGYDSTLGLVCNPLASSYLPISNPIITGHLTYTGTVPTIAAGTGAGTSPTISISGVDNGGQISLTTGTLPAGSNAVIATVTYATAFPNSSVVTITPANAAAAALSGSGSPFPIPGTTTNFVFKGGITGLVAGTSYLWNYSVVGW